MKERYEKFKKGQYIGYENEYFILTPREAKVLSTKEGLILETKDERHAREAENKYLLTRFDPNDESVVKQTCKQLKFVKDISHEESISCLIAQNKDAFSPQYIDETEKIKLTNHHLSWLKEWFESWGKTLTDGNIIWKKGINDTEVFNNWITYKTHHSPYIFLMGNLPSEEIKIRNEKLKKYVDFWNNYMDNLRKEDNFYVDLFDICAQIMPDDDRFQKTKGQTDDFVSDYFKSIVNFSLDLLSCKWKIKEVNGLVMQPTDMNNFFTENLPLWILDFPNMCELIFQPSVLPQFHLLLLNIILFTDKMNNSNNNELYAKTVFKLYFYYSIVSFFQYQEYIEHTDNALHLSWSDGKSRTWWSPKYIESWKNNGGTITTLRMLLDSEDIQKLFIWFGPHTNVNTMMEDNPELGICPGGNLCYDYIFGNVSNIYIKPEFAKEIETNGDYGLNMDSKNRTNDEFVKKKSRILITILLKNYWRKYWFHYYRRKCQKNRKN